MPRFIEGQDRHQVTLLPESLDDFIAKDNAVRVVDAFVNELDLAELGFEGVQAAETGRPSYHPTVLLKIYIYGYLNRVQSSRRLERECQRNLEVMWLTGRLAPDFKTIADFRRDNGKGIRGACSRFVELCRHMKLFSQAAVAIDGSKFKAVNSRDRNFTPAKIAARKKQIEESIERYMGELDDADRNHPGEFVAKLTRLTDKIKTLREQMRRMDGLQKQLDKQEEAQISLTDPDSRAMKSQATGSGVVGYNVQVAVDTKHHLIVAHEVTNATSDRQQLTKVAQAAREAMSKPLLRAYADRGYFNAQQIKDCSDSGIVAFVPKPMTSNAKAEGRFDKRDFIYIAKDDEYQCPAGQRAVYRYTREESGLEIHRYWSSACPQCPIKAQCTPSKYRRISRWEHEPVLEAMQRRLNLQPEAMTLRRCTVEHVFGTLKHWMGSTHFLTRRLVNVGTEMSLHVLAYNLKRVINILGIAKTLKAVSSMGA
jgi:transposase